VPHLQRDFLEKILAIGTGGAIDARDLEQDGLVRLHPALEYLIPFSFQHRFYPFAALVAGLREFLTRKSPLKDLPEKQSFEDRDGAVPKIHQNARH
jgi:hypothetical protein